MLSQHSLFRSALALVALGCSTLAHGLQPQNRVGVVDRASTATVAHNVPGRARLSSDLGEAQGNRTLPDITLHFSRSAAQQAALDQLLAAQQTPGNPLFHKWLTPAQFGAQFGLSSADVAKVTAWLTSAGLTVTEVSPDNTYVRVSGTVAAAQKAFAVSIHALRFQGEQHLSNLSDPVLPAAIAPVVTGITGLSDFHPHSHARIVTIPASEVRPDFTSSQGGAHYVTPADFSTIYDLKPLLSSAVNGSNQTIAVMGQTDISLSDVAAFRAAAGLVANVPSVLLVSSDPGTLNSEIAEAQLDVEWSGGVAPNARIIYVDSTDVFSSLEYAITHATAPILSISYGLCEPASDQATLYALNQYLQQANAQGQTLIAPGGDSGATDCDNGTASAADGLAVDFPASSPNATGIGGLTFNEGAGSYWAAATTSTVGNTTTTTDTISSALSYIPESVWNETSPANGLAAGGGGASILFAKPSWQVGLGVPADSARDVPDLALNAAVYHDPYLFCVQGSCVNGFRSSTGALAAVGGTSVGAPSFAGILALIEQKIGANGLGNINPVLYGLAGTSASSVFHDVTSGSNSSPCLPGSPNCGSSGSIGYAATTGYDQASGWGSVDGFNLASLWSTAVPAPSTSGTGTQVSVTTVRLNTGQTTCAINGAAVTLNISVAGAQTNTVPTGTVQLFVDGASSGSPVALISGQATLSVNTVSLASGGHTVSVQYSGDTTFQSSRGNLGPTISPLGESANQVSSEEFVPSVLDVVSTTQPDFSLAPCLPSLTVRTGMTSAAIALTATSLNGFSGPVTFTASSDGYLLARYTFSATTATVSGAAPGTTSFTLTASQTTTSSNQDRRLVYGAGAGTLALAMLLCLRLPRTRRPLGLLAVLLSVTTLTLSGCGSGVASLPASGVTPTPSTQQNAMVGTYIVNLTATGTNSQGQPLVHTTYLSLTVTN